MSYRTIRTMIVTVALSLALGACGQADRGSNAGTAAPLAAPSPTLAHTAMPRVPTEAVTSETPTAFVMTLVDVNAPSSATPPPTSNQPLVVSPIVTPTIELRVGGQTLMVELAFTSDQRERGLMFRSQMAANAGMLFVFPNDQNLSFWMRNTQLPLSIAFIDANQRILNIEEMQAFDDKTFHQSRGPARYALELNKGWFAQYGVIAGDQVEFTLPANLDIR
jgi:uncharacterized membrane protein (UPF0127 family)